MTTHARQPCNCEHRRDGRLLRLPAWITGGRSLAPGVVSTSSPNDIHSTEPPPNDYTDKICTASSRTTTTQTHDIKLYDYIEL
jgi:hypothetical protein